MSSEQADEAAAKKYGGQVLDAASKGNLPAVRHCVRTWPGAVHERNEYGDTALMRAAFRGHLKVVRFLLDAGADGKAADKQGKTALDYARERGHVKIAQYLESAATAAADDETDKKRLEATSSSDLGAGTAQEAAPAEDEVMKDATKCDDSASHPPQESSPAARWLADSSQLAAAEPTPAASSAGDATLALPPEQAAMAPAPAPVAPAPQVPAPQAPAPQAENETTASTGCPWQRVVPIPSWCCCFWRTPRTPSQASRMAKVQAAPGPPVPRLRAHARHLFLSGRFNEDSKLEYFKKVRDRLELKGVPTSMVEASTGDDFGPMTMEGLYDARAMVAFCTSDYGEQTGAMFETYFELRYAWREQIPIIPVQNCSTFPPKPRGKPGKVQNSWVLSGTVLRVVDEDMSEPERVADEIAENYWSKLPNRFDLRDPD